jgi:hypothetical protein
LAPTNLSSRERRVSGVKIADVVVEVERAEKMPKGTERAVVSSIGFLKR